MIFMKTKTPGRFTTLLLLLVAVLLQTVGCPGGCAWLT